VCKHALYETNCSKTFRFEMKMFYKDKYIFKSDYLNGVLVFRR